MPLCLPGGTTGNITTGTCETSRTPRGLVVPPCSSAALFSTTDLSGILRPRPANGPGVFVGNGAEHPIVEHQFAVRLAIADGEACGVEVEVTNELIQAFGRNPARSAGPISPMPR